MTVQLNNGVYNDPRQTTTTEFFVAFQLWLASTQPFVGVNAATNSLVVAEDAFFAFKGGLWFRNFAELAIGTANLEQGTVFAGETRYYVWFAGDNRFVINTTKEQPNNALFVATFSTTAGGYIDAGTLYDSQMYKADQARYRVGDMLARLPGQASPVDRYPMQNWQNISASFAGDFFRVADGLTGGYDSGRHPDSAPNITASVQNSAYNTVSGFETMTGAFRGTVGSRYTMAASTTLFNVGTNKLEFDASRSNAAYGRRAEVAPAHQYIEYYQLVGTVSGVMQVSVIDSENAFVQTQELSIDEAGVVGYNSNVHVDIVPSKQMLAKRSTRTQLVWDRETKEWTSQVIPTPAPTEPLDSYSED